ncbi:hypothetical protein HKCCSP123_18795, partial [Rhodobacterales bacterium HKCCSP123]|nr:hypothetical protein [Rhodobacterales bacterium HKCCSP123]
MCMTCAMFNPFGGDWLHAAGTDRTIDESTLPGGDAPDAADPTVQLEVGDTVNGELDGAFDWDWYYVEYEAGQTYTFTVTPGTLGDPLLWFADENGERFINVDFGYWGEEEVFVYTATTSGSGYIVVDSYYNTINENDPDIGTDTGTYSLSVTAVPTPPPPPPGTTDPLASIDGTYAAPSVINVYFAPGGVGFSDAFEPTVTTGGWSEFEIQQAQLAFELFENVANLTFNYVEDPNAADFFMVERPGDDLLGYWAVGGVDVTLDGVTHTGLDGHGVFYGDGFGWNDPGLVQGGYGFITLIHEIGHGLGLMHPHDTGNGTTIMSGVTQAGFFSYTTGHFDLNQGIYTTMSYNDGWQTAPHEVSPADTYGFQGTPMAFDVAILQATYGANMSYNTGDDTYVLPTANAPGAFYAAIWDAGGTDTIVHTGSTAAVIDLREAPLISDENGGGYVSHVQGIHGGFTIAAGASIENATGGGGADTIIGNDLGNVIQGLQGNDWLEGGGGDDVIRGNLNADTIDGGSG